MNGSVLPAHLIDLVIAITLVEATGLALYRRATGRGVAPRDWALNMASGLCLMGALRSLAQDAGVAWVASFLLAAGIAHAFDIARRWQHGHATA